MNFKLSGLTTSEDENAGKERGSQQPTGHPGVDRYVDSASSWNNTNVTNQSTYPSFGIEIACYIFPHTKFPLSSANIYTLAMCPRFYLPYIPLPLFYFFFFVYIYASPSFSAHNLIPIYCIDLFLLSFDLCNQRILRSMKLE